MDDIKVISGNTEQEVWAVIEADLAADPELLSYDVLIRQGSRNVELYIDIDPGGGFESGWETTQLIAPLSVMPGFKFAVHEEDFIDELGRFFGMQDVRTGFEDLDKHIVIKTDNEEKVRQLFADAEIRELFTSLEDFDLGIHTVQVEDSDAEQPVLELNINEAITDAASLRAVYRAFYKLLEGIER